MEFHEKDGLVYDEKDEVVFCEAEVHPAVFYLPNGDPGYPAEYCEDEATHVEGGVPLCYVHTGYGAEDYGPDPDDERDRMMEARDEW